MFGLDEEQTRRAGSVLKELGTGWRQLVAGREGFLVERKRAGLLRQKVVWGEMDSMVCLYPFAPLRGRIVGEWGRKEEPYWGSA